MIDIPKLLPTVGALVLLAGGGLGLRRGEIWRRRRWGEFGGPKELPPIRGQAAVAYSVWLLAAGAAVLAWTWWR